METYLTVKEVALMVQLSIVTIRRYTMRNEIPFHKIYRAVRYKKSEIEQWVEKKDKTLAAELGKDQSEKPVDGILTETKTGGEV